jgi:hypothetical protein
LFDDFSRIETFGGFGYWTAAGACSALIAGSYGFAA